MNTNEYNPLVFTLYTFALTSLTGETIYVVMSCPVMKSWLTLFVSSGKSKAYIGLEYTSENLLLDVNTGREKMGPYDNWADGHPVGSGCVFYNAAFNNWEVDDCSKDAVVCITVEQGGEL